MTEQVASYGAAPQDTHDACPFCGGAAGLIPYVDYGIEKFRIGCDACDTAGGLYATEAAAWQAWDTRAAANDTDIRTIVDGLLSAIEQEWTEQRIGEVAAAMATFRTYAESKLTALVGRAARGRGTE